MAVSPEKISVHSLADLKNTSDDAIAGYLNSLNFTQNHFQSDVRLMLGYSAFTVCAACFYWDYKLGFEATKWYTAAAVAIYTLINSILMYWVWAVENGKVYTGTSPKGDIINIRSATTKHIPVYNLTITTHTKDKAATQNVVKISRPFTEWFDAAGHFVSLPFQQMFASNVTVIGLADPKRVVKGEGKREKKAPVDDGKTMDEKWASLLAESSGAAEAEEAKTTGTPGKSGKKRSKKT